MSVTAPVETLTRAVDIAGSASALAKALDYDRAKRERLYRALRGDVQRVGHDLVADAEGYLAEGADGPSGPVEDRPGDRPMSWDDVCADPVLRRLPFKIEQDRYGRILMSPPYARHAKLQFRIAHLLFDTLEGTAATECPVRTRDGVKVPDVVWMSDEFERKHGTLTVYEVAPPICVEVMSPSNPWAEMEEKVTLYLAKGAQEVWICEPDGRLRFFGHEGERETSTLVPDAPATVTL